MKKILIIAVAALFVGSAAKAQDVMKQTGGEQNFEVLFKPLGGSPIGINGIKYRKFTSATSAIRATVFVGFGSSTDIINEDPEMKSSSSNFDISIRPGIEQHFVGTDRLSPYVGGEAIIGFSTSGTKTDTQDPTDPDNFEALKTSSGVFSVGVNAIAGMDFYFADNIYLGAEFGFGIQFDKNLTTKSESFDVDGDIETNEAKGGSAFNIGPNAVGAIRLGFLF